MPACSLLSAPTLLAGTFHDLRQATAVTITGQFLIRWSERKVNAYLNKVMGTKDEDYVVFIHTDSIYVCFDKFVKKVYGDATLDPHEVTRFLDRVCKEKILAVIAEGFDELAKAMNVFESRITMKREAISSRAIFLGKNRYYLDVYDMEGDHKTEPELKTVGLEAIRSAIPEAVRNAIKEAQKIIIRKDIHAMRAFVREFRKQFDNLEVEDISIAIGINVFDKYTAEKNEDASFMEDFFGKDTAWSPENQWKIPTKTPGHVRAAMIYNRLLVERQVDGIYGSIKSGEKIKVVSLMNPNPVNAKSIAFKDKFPPEFNLHPYVNRHEMFSKTFLAPVRRITDAMRWVIDDGRVSTLEALWEF